jgi:hypothetical protein
MRLLIAVSLFLLLVILACESTETPIQQATPKEAAQGFLKAMNAENYDLAARYVSASSRESLQNFRTNLNMISEEEKKTLLEAYKVPVGEINCQEQQGETRCSFSTPEGDGVLPLVQQDEKWFVQMDFDF